MAEKHFGFPCTSRSTEHVSKGGERCKYGISVPTKESCSCNNNQSLLFKDVSPIIIVVLYFSNNPRVQSIMEPSTFWIVPNENYKWNSFKGERIFNQKLEEKKLIENWLPLKTGPHFSHPLPRIWIPHLIDSHKTKFDDDQYHNVFSHKPTLMNNPKCHSPKTKTQVSLWFHDFIGRKRKREPSPPPPTNTHTQKKTTTEASI